MPCDDITEQIELRVDHEGLLVHYSLRKRTCGAEVGAASLLLSWLYKRPIQDLLALEEEDLHQHFEATAQRTTQTLEFLRMKHWVALRSSIQVLLGMARGTPESLCQAAEIASDAQGIAFTGIIPVGLLTEHIRACRGCGSCGSKTQASSAPQTPASVPNLLLQIL